MVIGFIGLGNMASAMVRGIAAAQLEGVALCGHNPHPEKAKALAESCGLRLCASNREVLERSDVVVLAVKPQILEGVLEEIAPLAAGKLFLSVAAGKELAWLSARLGHGCIVRAMPEVFQEVIAGAHGDHGHGRVVVADNAVGHLVGGAVTAAGVEPQLLTAVAQPLGDLCGVPLFLGQDALHIQIMLCPQGLCHVVYLLAAVSFARRGIDDENVLHRKTPPPINCLGKTLRFS